MNSFNHYSLGSCGEWMFDTVAGIGMDLDQPGYKRIVIHPVPGGALTWAQGCYDSITGRIVSNWKIENGKIVMDVTIPSNTTATVYIPTARPDGVTESGLPVATATGVKVLRTNVTNLVLEVGGGTYRFIGDVGRR